jgi:hypothetical protein
MRMNMMRLATVVVGAGLLVAAAVGPANAGAAAGAPAAAVTRDSFELGMDGWQADTDGRARAWQIYRTTERAFDGRYSLGLFLNGHNDEGIIWIERRFAARANATVTVTASFWLYSPSGGDVNTWATVGYAGRNDPETTLEMRSIVGFVNKAGWTKYTFTRKVVTDGTGAVWVAVGLWATYETIRTNHLDLVETSIA